ncbi:hypothetical protein CHK_0488 [Christensenella hongkongensis]|uniref:Uncharacterized protein n=1 Tax=Christensenella hongkongensis TaxID=270498 RepID=A0A0M2NLW3_9FIRM|nr:hypothetical protein CHK_0488 [Christensenella hongkongensis]
MKSNTICKREREEAFSFCYAVFVSRQEKICVRLTLHMEYSNMK